MIYLLSRSTLVGAHLESVGPDVSRPGRGGRMQQVVYESMVMQQLPGKEGRAQGSSVHIQEEMTTPKAAFGGQTGHPYISRFSITATVPPAIDSHTVFARADDLSTILGMLKSPHTSAVVLSGEPGAGKSTLAA